MILATIAMLAAQPTSMVDEEALRAGAPVVRIFLEEARDAYYQASPDRTIFIVSTRPRQTHVGGLCARDEMRMEMAPAAAGPRRARIRALEVVHRFHVLRTESGVPRWDVTWDALEDACAGIDEGASRWIEAETPDDAQAGVLGLLAVVRALGEPHSPLIRVRCRGRNCFDRAQVAALIAPLDPESIRRPAATRCGANDRYRCQVFFLVDVAICGGWQVEVESGWDEPFRLRSATFIRRAHIAIHCNGEES